MKEIFSALAKAQKQFEAALKQSENPHFRSKYASLEACVEAVRSSLNDQGIFLTQTVESVDRGIMIETVFAHESGDVYTGGKLFMPVMKVDAQGYGSAITYGRRYSLLTACGVAPADDDDGNGAAKNAPKDNPKSEPETPEFDIVKVLEKVEACTTEDQLSALWKAESMNAQLANKGAYGALKAACKDRKAALQGVAV